MNVLRLRKLISPRIKNYLVYWEVFFIITLGILLLQLKTPFETVSAIEISGILFIQIGFTGIGDFTYRIIRRYCDEYSMNPPTVKLHQ
jgi:hypothetical protein